MCRYSLNLLDNKQLIHGTLKNRILRNIVPSVLKSNQLFFFFWKNSNFFLPTLVTRLTNTHTVSQWKSNNHITWQYVSCEVHVNILSVALIPTFFYKKRLLDIFIAQMWQTLKNEHSTHNTSFSLPSGNQWTNIQSEINKIWFNFSLQLSHYGHPLLCVVM